MGMRRLPGHLAWLVMLPLAACAPQLSSELGDEASVTQHTGPLITESSSGATLTESWAQYTINVGAHSASVSGAAPGNSSGQTRPIREVCITHLLRNQESHRTLVVQAQRSRGRARLDLA